jgi:iron complex outermembrane receptor protein
MSNSCRCHRSLPFMALLCCTLLATGAMAADDASVEDLTRLSLEELGNLRITSVSKRAEPLAQAPASVFVITSDEILASGATTLPEILRLAPNLQVAQVSSGGYAITARGLNGSNNSAPNKLLVMIDGRSVYSPLFSGVFWDVQGVMPENIERIEVISGPGSTLWGVNAVNGVVNVVTRTAGDSGGTLLAVSAGPDRQSAGIRQGVAWGDSALRLHARASNWRHGRTAGGDAVNDAGHLVQVGLRYDWARGDDQLSVFGNAYQAREGQPAPGAIQVIGLEVPLGDIEASGANLIARWQRTLAGDGTLELQAYLDHSERAVPPMFSEVLTVADLQLQHALPKRGAHAFTWGLNLRHASDEVDNSVYVAFLPADVEQQWTSVFGQDDITLGDRVTLTVGARLERNDYTGWEFLPSARVAWTSERHLLWAAASRAVRAPSRLDHDAFIPGVPPFLLDGGPQVRSEIARVLELGYRGQPGARVSWSATAFHADYDHLRTQEIDPGFTFLTFANGMRGRVWGLEGWGMLQATRDLRLSAGFTALRRHLELKPGSNDLAAPLAAGNDPSLAWQAGARWDLRPRLRLDADLRRVHALARNEVPAYTVLDLRMGWQPMGGVELLLAGRNLLARHVEYGLPEYRMVIEPQVSFTVRWEIR